MHYFLDFMNLQQTMKKCGPYGPWYISSWYETCWYDTKQHRKPINAKFRKGKLDFKLRYCKKKTYFGYEIKGFLIIS